MIISFKIFEKTSLTNIGVPYLVMKGIQRDYSISSDAQWKKLRYKKDITLVLHKNDNNLIIAVCEKIINIIFSYNKEYYIEKYELIESDDFGHEKWERVDRVKTTKTDVVKRTQKGCQLYQLMKGNWFPEYSNVRKINKEQRDFEEVTNEFKIEFAKNFTKIIKRIYGKKSVMVTDIIIDYLKDVNKDESEQSLREILFLNVQNAKDVVNYRRKSKETDPYKLYDKNIKADSLTIFDEYILKFEQGYSDKYKEYLNLSEMIERWSRDKISTAFSIFLFCGKIIDL